MSTKKSPFARITGEHESKEKLVDKLVGMLGQISVDKSESGEDLKGRLLGASNKKLLHLLEVGGEIKSKFGSVEKAAEALAQSLGRAKDADYVTKLKTFAPGKLLDLYRTAEKRAKSKKAA